MQSAETLSNEQIKTLSSKVRLIEAGPGSGKTRSVVARFRQRAMSTGRGIALLSFTNAAVDVARSRCRNFPKLLDPPNFVGTFDEFFRRYVLTPSIQRISGSAPRFVGSWDELSDSLAIVRTAAGKSGIRLSVFTLDSHGLFRADETRMRRAEKTLWEKVTPWTRQNLTEIAAARFRELHAAHVYDAESARTSALEILVEPDSQLLSLLRRRFAETIVDEFQDCDEREHRMLQILHEAHIHVVAVADPDQAIYEFRQTSTESYQKYRYGLAHDEIATLTQCFRSPPAVCAIADSLRSVGLTKIVSAGDHFDAPSEVFVIVGTGKSAAEAAVAIARQHGVFADGVRIVAHRKSDARALAGGGNQPPRGTSVMEPMLTALAELRSSTELTSRMAAIAQLERFFLHQLTVIDDQPRTPSEQLKRLNLLPDHVRYLVSELVEAAKSWPDAAACSASVRALIEKLSSLTAESVELAPNLGQRLRVQPKVWKFWQSRVDSGLFDGTAERTRWSHIHGVKGHEFNAVVVAIPAFKRGQKHVLDDWESGLNSEQRRVLYVGVSRARRVLVLVVPKSRCGQLEKILTATDVPYRLLSAA